MKCDICGKDAATIIAMVNMATKDAQHVCDDCLIDNTPQINDITELDKNIDIVQSTLKDMEELQKLLSENKEGGKENEETGPGSDSDMFFTSENAYKMVKKTCDNLAIQKLQLLTSMPEPDRLKYELKVAIDTENYEKAAELRDKINALNSNES